MALFRALESARPASERLFDDPWAARFLGRKLRLAAQAARVPVLGRLIPWMIDRRWPGPRPSGVVRTRVIDDLVVEGTRCGCRQLVLLGAGYDTRGARLPVAADVAVWEIDHPSTQARKRAVLGAAAANTTYVGVDFERDDLGDAMARAGFSCGLRSCVVWEGVLSYLTVEAIDKTLAWIVACSAPGSRLVLTYVDRSALAKPDDAPWIEAVRSAGEPFITGLDPADAGGL